MRENKSTHSSTGLIVSLIGRPNVGKSTLFNRLMHYQHKAITYDEPGVTRDRHYGLAEVDVFPEKGKPARELSYILVDTGGFFPEKIQLREEGNKPNHQKRKQKDINHDVFFNSMASHARTAINESALVLFIVDGKSGPSPFDEQIMQEIRRSQKRFLVLINKCDPTIKRDPVTLMTPFYKLGVQEEDMMMVSAAHGPGVGFLEDRIGEILLVVEKEREAIRLEERKELQLKGILPRENVVAKLAIIGAPNVGKSTLLNRLVGGERALVSNIPGTTVDPIEAYFDLYFGAKALALFEKADKAQAEKERGTVDEVMEEVAQDSGQDEHEPQPDGVPESPLDLMPVEDAPSAPKGNFWRSVQIVDTAGIRKKSMVKDPVESVSVFRALSAIDQADIVIYVADANSGIHHQDRRLIDIAMEKGRSVVIALNKRDLISGGLKNPKDQKKWLEQMRTPIPWLEHCEIIPISAQKGDGLNQLKDSIKHTIEQRYRKISTSGLIKLLQDLTDRHPITLKNSRGMPLRIKYATQVKSGPPTFLLFTNKANDVPDHYRRYLQNAIRTHFRLRNTPIHLVFRTGDQVIKDSGPTSSERRTP